MMNTPALRRVLRLDNIALTKAYFTEEGYLIDNPIVTSVGIFEYALPGGGVRRELRLPDHVFDPESLASYEGKPIIITHDAGTVDKDNVEKHQVGTILTKGYRDGDDVKVKIIIHDTDAMKEADLKELSLGYNLDLDETPGVWEGQPYDAIQTNIRINHLALVENARAGHQARLNIDGRDHELKGAKLSMANSNSKTRRDSEGMSPEDFAAAIEKFKARRAARMAAKNPDGEGEAPAAIPPVEEAPAAEDCDLPVADSEGEGASAEQQTQMVKDRRDQRDGCGDPANLDEAMHTIAQQDEDIETLLGVIDAMCAGGQAHDEDDVEGAEEGSEEPAKEDSDEGESGAMNADSIDAIVRERVKLARIGDRLNIDGMDAMSAKDAKKAIIKKLKPSLRLDGQSDSYIQAAFDLALSEMGNRKDTNFQRKQMFNGDGAKTAPAANSAALESRQKMIEKKIGGTK